MIGHRPAVVLVVIGLLAGSCGSSPSTSPTPTPETVPGHAEAVDGRFRLTFDLPKTTWSVADAIAGTATLALLGGGSVELGGSGQGLFGFAFDEIGGRRHMVPAWTADCRPYRLEAGQPMTSAILKSGGFAGDDPEAAFYRAFFQDPLLHLPAGQWRITAVASFLEGRDCSGPDHDVQAAILVLVTP
jgi:hypothetical protein